MTVHDEYLELAAAAIDFDLSPAETARLDLHLSTCVPCRRRVAGLRHDAAATRQLAPFVLDPERAQRVWRRIEQPRRTSMSPGRLLALAALLALLAVSGLAGAASLRRDDLSEVVTPPPSVAEVTEVSPVPSLPPSQVVPQTQGFAAGTIVEIVVTGLRVRTAPTVDDSRSAKLEPLLGLGVELRIVEGPVVADDYEWYRVEAMDGYPHRGWVAAADHDGEPWIEDPEVRDLPSDKLSEVERSILAVVRSDAATACGPRTAGLPSGSIGGIECRLDTALVARVGAYRFGSAEEAATAYLERLSTSGVTLGSGDCAAGRIGDAAWSDGTAVSVQFAGSEWPTSRVGCFLDQSGTANVRATCGTTYIGILGRNEDLAALHEWAWAEPDSDGSDRSKPGICASASTD
jgi:anti-sigma factor RsiW